MMANERALVVADVGQNDATERYLDSRNPEPWKEDHALQIKLVEMLRDFDTFLSAVERINRHKPTTAKYLFRIIEVSDEMLVELKRAKVRLWNL